MFKLLIEIGFGVLLFLYLKAESDISDLKKIIAEEVTKKQNDLHYLYDEYSYGSYDEFIRGAFPGCVNWVKIGNNDVKVIFKDGTYVTRTVTKKDCKYSVK